MAVGTIAGPAEGEGELGTDTSHLGSFRIALAIVKSPGLGLAF